MSPLLLLGAACVASSPTPAAPAPAGPGPSTALPVGGRRVVAVGDLHGDRENAIAVLKLAGLVDDQGHWTGGDAILVQTGDDVDRGPDSKGVLALLRGLQAEAPATGGLVVPLLGNHEVMNMRGDWRYVSPDDLAGYGGQEARSAALRPDGEDGRWLRSLDATAKVGDTVFVHGGITPGWATKGTDALARLVRGAIDAGGQPPVLGEDGPLWYRGYVNDPEDRACPQLDRALEALGARRMVVGHTTRDDGRVEARCGGRLLVIDLGISHHYGSHLGALELRGGTDAWADYPSGPEDLPDP